MPTSLSAYLASDHDRMDNFLQQALTESGDINLTAYNEFRQGLLRHIGIEEKILIPALQPFFNERMKQILIQIKADHSLIVALLVPPPSRGIVAALRMILEKHNWLEEANGGFYEFSEQFDVQTISQLEEKIRTAPEVKSLPNNPDPKVLAATRRALERAGYNPDEYLN